MPGTYTRGEVVWLLGLSYGEALRIDTEPRDSCAGLSKDTISTHTADDGPPLFTVVRWSEVHATRRRLGIEKRADLATRMRAAGYTEHEVVALLQMPKTTMRRRVTATVDEILAALGGEHEEEQRTSAPSACMVCAAAPRVRLEPVLRRVRGGWRTVVPARLSSLCRQCLPSEYQERVA